MSTKSALLAFKADGTTLVFDETAEQSRLTPIESLQSSLEDRPWLDGTPIVSLNRVYKDGVGFYIDWDKPKAIKVTSVAAKPAETGKKIVTVTNYYATATSEREDATRGTAEFGAILTYRSQWSDENVRIIDPAPLRHGKYQGIAAEILAASDIDPDSLTKIQITRAQCVEKTIKLGADGDTKVTVEEAPATPATPATVKVEAA